MPSTNLSPFLRPDLRRRRTSIAALKGTMIPRSLGLGYGSKPRTTETSKSIGRLRSAARGSAFPKTL